MNEIIEKIQNYLGEDYNLQTSGKVAWICHQAKVISNIDLNYAEYLESIGELKEHLINLIETKQI